METLLGTKLGSFGGPESLREAKIGAEVLVRARERKRGYFPQDLFKELMTSLPCTSLETQSLAVDENGNVYFNLVPRSMQDEVKEWQGGHHGVGVMLREYEIDPSGSIKQAWERLISDEMAEGAMVGPFDLCTQALDTNGRGKEVAWIHIFQVSPDIKSGVMIPLKGLDKVKIIPHHRQIIGRVLNDLPLRIGKGRRASDFQFVDKAGMPNAELSLAVAEQLIFYKDKFPIPEK